MEVLVVTDADNTLWDTDAVYASAQEALLDEVQEIACATGVEGDRLSFVRQVDEQLAQLHAGDLGYPPVKLATALALASTGHPPRAAAQEAHRRNVHESAYVAIAQRFLDRVNGATPPLRPGVRSGLQQLKKCGARIVLVSEGAEARCLRLLESHQIRQYFEAIVFAPKSTSLYRDLAIRFGRGGLGRFLIGDQLDRDIDMSHRAGFVTIYFPGGFNPSWQSKEIGLVRPDHRVDNFQDAATIILKSRRSAHDGCHG